MRNKDVGSPIPLWKWFFRGRGRDRETGETKTSEDGSAFGQGPNGVVFATLDRAIDLVKEEAMKQEG